MKLPIHLLLFGSLLLAGCEKDIDLPLREAESTLVVDANIENGQPPVVVLTTSFGYFSRINATLLANSFVHDARIVVSSGVDSTVLREYTYPVGGTAVYFYTIDSAATTAPLRGQLNRRYTLTISTDGKQYTAQTTIPMLAKTVDSLWAKPAPNNPDTLKRVLFSKLTDPRGLGNYIRYFTSVNDSAYLPGLNSVYDDDVVDGTTYDIQVFKGADRSTDIDPDEFGYFKKGDTVSVKLCNIDRASYDFWRSLEYLQQSIGNPFSLPSVVLGNVSGGALGCFSGYAAQYKKIIIAN
jgi:hypothetical protein